MELGEVEHHVRQSLGSGILVVAEVITPSGSSNSMLVAFLAFGKEAAGSAEEATVTPGQLVLGLEKILAESLPAYMVLRTFIQIDRVPMTATGKTDRRQLHEMGELLTLEQLMELQPYRRTIWVLVTEMERRLQILWASVLGTEVSGIGADDTFLRIGGDSIGVLRMVREARNQGLSLPAADLSAHQGCVSSRVS